MRLVNGNHGDVEGGQHVPEGLVAKAFRGDVKQFDVAVKTTR